MATDQKTTEEINKKKSFSEADLTKKEKEYLRFFNTRIEELKEARTNIFGINLEDVWKDADKDYIPHKLSSPGKKVVATDEEKGWRGSMVTLGQENNWQFDAQKPNPYVKIQTALSILIDRNPTGVFTPGSKRFENATKLMESLYKRSWDIAKSKQQLKLFIFNLAKYGWAIARTYPLKLTRTSRVIKEYNEDFPEDSVFEEKEVVEYNDIFRENLDPWNCWIDDMAKPNNPMTTRDWAWRKIYAWDVADEEFGHLKNWKFVRPGGNLDQQLNNETKGKITETNTVEVFFYENKIKDLFMVVANGVPLLIEPLPISDEEGRKKLSCWHTFWNIRHAESPYGIGIYEAIRNDSIALNRIRCMTVDQLTLSIYKMFFYQGTNSLTEGGQIRVAPGVGKQVMDPKGITWLDVPGPGPQAWEGIEKFQEDIDRDSGITDPLMGEITGKTAFEIAQAKESALKRLKTPLDNICDALEEDGYITVSLIQMIYSTPEIVKITDPVLIEDYLEEIQGDQELYERNEQGEFLAKIYKEIQMGLEEDEFGNLIEAPESRFFRLKPSKMAWDGIISIDPQSILTPSKELSKALDLEMLNVVGEMMGKTTLEMQMAMQMGQKMPLNETTYGKVIKNILKTYEKDPKDWLPDSWLEKPSIVGNEQLIIPQTQMMGGMPGQPMGSQMTTGAPTPTAPQNPQGVAGGMMSGLINKLTGRGQ